MPFAVNARSDDHHLSASFETAKEALAKAVEWLESGLNDVRICVNEKTYTPIAFALL
jgi:hypothetical protein